MLFGRDIQVAIRSLLSSASLTWIINTIIIAWKKISAEKAGSSFLGSSFCTRSVGVLKTKMLKTKMEDPTEEYMRIN